MPLSFFISFSLSVVTGRHQSSLFIHWLCPTDSLRAHSGAQPAMPSHPSPMQSLFHVLQEKYPQYHTHIGAVETYARKLSTALDSTSPYVAHGAKYVGTAKAYATTCGLHELTPMLIGLCICFFGSHYTMLIAVVETVRILCWQDLKHSYDILYRNYSVAIEQSRKDDMVDADGNGVPDVLELAKAELLSRKMTIFMKSVDVDEMKVATRTFGAAAMAVIASLRVQFARSLALGSALASLVKEYIPLEALMKECLPPDMQKWSSVFASVVLNGIAILLATLLGGILSTVHCCARGSDIFVQHAVRIAKERGLLEEGITMETVKVRSLVAVIATMGFLWQMTHQNAVPFPLNLLMLPFSFAEGVLRIVVGVVLAAAP